MEQLKADEYGIFAIGNKIVVCGRTRSSSVLAIEKFVEHLKSSVTKDDKGKVSLSLVYERPLIYKNTSYKTDIPEFASGRLSGAYDCGDGVLEMYYTGVTQADYDSYCEAAGKAGFSDLFAHRGVKYLQDIFGWQNAVFCLVFGRGGRAQTHHRGRGNDVGSRRDGHIFGGVRALGHTACPLLHQGQHQRHGVCVAALGRQFCHL